MKVSNQRVIRQVDKQEHHQHANTDHHSFEPGRWWFASTACPLLVCTFGPIASGFNVCALVAPWRTIIVSNGPSSQRVHVNDPGWLIAINAVSLCAAMFGNAALLLNIAKRLSFAVAQAMTISGFMLGSILLIADVAVLSSSPTYFIVENYSTPRMDRAVTSAYYYAIIAAATYMVLALFLCLTVYGANVGHYPKDIRLTNAQHTLMLQTIAFMAYLLIGSLIFSKIEGWPYLDAVYWADVTMLTIGFGDIVPTTMLGRGLFMPFAIGGVLAIGLVGASLPPVLHPMSGFANDSLQQVVGSIRTLVLQRGREKMAARITEKRRTAAVSDVQQRRHTIHISRFVKADFSPDPRLSPAQQREEEFNLMRRVLATAERERRWFSLLTSVLFAAAL
jgi:potassium channel subfamily K